MEPGILETKSLWYHYKTEVWPEEIPQTAIVHNIMKTLRSIRFNQFAYVTVPVTTGRTYYDERRKDPHGDHGALMRRVIALNYGLGYQLVERLAETLNYPVLYPADLTPRHGDWEQKHFQALWLNIIAELCTEVHLCDGWNYSSGSVEEFTHVMQLKLGLPRHPNLIFLNTKGDEAAERMRMRNIIVFDNWGSPVSLEDGCMLIREAISELDPEFPTDRLKRGLERLEWTGRMLAEGYYQ